MNKIKELQNKLKEKEEKISKAERVKSLLLKQKGLWKKQQSLTDFQEPVLFLARRNGEIEIYEKATAGKFIFDHSNGKPRFLELRPSDQRTFPYGDRRFRCYIAHEDRPFADWEEPIRDSEDIMKGYEKTKATDLKYEQSLERLKNAGKMTWVWIAIGIAIAVAIIGFAYATWIQPALSKKAIEESAKAIPPTAGIIGLWLKNKKREIVAIFK